MCKSWTQYVWVSCHQAPDPSCHKTSEYRKQHPIQPPTQAFPWDVERKSMASAIRLRPQIRARTSIQHRGPLALYRRVAGLDATSSRPRTALITS